MDITAILALCDTQPPFEVQTCEQDGEPGDWRPLIHRHYESRIHAIKALVDVTLPYRPDLGAFRILDTRTNEVVWGNRGDWKPRRRRRR